MKLNPGNYVLSEYLCPLLVGQYMTGEANNSNNQNTQSDKLRFDFGKNDVYLEGRKKYLDFKDELVGLLTGGGMGKTDSSAFPSHLDKLSVQDYVSRVGAKRSETDIEGSFKKLQLIENSIMKHFPDSLLLPEEHFSSMNYGNQVAYFDCLVREILYDSPSKTGGSNRLKRRERLVRNWYSQKVLPQISRSELMEVLAEVNQVMIHPLQLSSMKLSRQVQELTHLDQTCELFKKQGKKINLNLIRQSDHLEEQVAFSMEQVDLLGKLNTEISSFLEKKPQRYALLLERVNDSIQTTNDPRLVMSLQGFQKWLQLDYT